MQKPDSMLIIIILLSLPILILGIHIIWIIITHITAKFIYDVKQELKDMEK